MVAVVTETTDIIHRVVLIEAQDHGYRLGRVVVVAVVVIGVEMTTAGTAEDHHPRPPEIGAIAAVPVSYIFFFCFYLKNFFGKQLFFKATENNYFV